MHVASRCCLPRPVGLCALLAVAHLATWALSACSNPKPSDAAGSVPSAMPASHAAAAPGPDQLAYGMTFVASDGGANLCLSAQDPNLATGSYVVARACDGTAAQRFVMSAQGLRLGPSLCLDAGAHVVLGSPATLQPCDAASPSQRFALVQGVLSVTVRDINFALSRGTLDASLQAPLSMAILDAAQMQQQWIAGLVTSPGASPTTSGVTLSPATHLTQCLDVANSLLVLNTCTASASQRFVWLPSGAMQMSTLCADNSQNTVTQPAAATMGPCDGAPSQSWAWHAGQLVVGDALCLAAGDANAVIDAPVTLGPCTSVTDTWVAGASVTP